MIKHACLSNYSKKSNSWNETKIVRIGRKPSMCWDEGRHIAARGFDEENLKAATKDNPQDSVLTRKVSTESGNSARFATPFFGDAGACPQWRSFSQQGDR